MLGFMEDLLMGERGRGVQRRMFLKAILPGVVWGIWKERNRRVFEDKTRSMWVVIDSIVCEINSWVLVGEFKNCSLNDMVRD